MAGEEIRIVAKLDTTDVVNGVERTARAAREMKQVWEESMAVGFPVDKIQDDFDRIQTIASDAGEKAGKGFFDGFLGKLLLRDAIYGLLSGFKEVFQEVQKGLESALGAGDGQGFSIWKNLAADIRATLNLIPAIGNATQGRQDAGIGSINAQELQRQTLDRIKADPSLLKEKSSDIAGQLETIDQQIADDKKKNFLFHQHQAEGVDKMPGDLSDPDFKASSQANNSQRAFLAELLSVAKENERKSAEADKEAGRKSAEATDKRRRDEETAMEHSRSEDRQDQAKKAKAAELALKREEAATKREEAKAKRDAAQQARIQKNRQQHANAQTIAGDEVMEHSANKDLDFTRRELDHQRATSAVHIGGGLFGRNDSAATLVQHAAVQISLLRSIDNELKQTRKNQSDLTLL